MLDAIRQQIAMEASQPLTSVPPPNPMQETTGFDQIMQTPAEPDRIEPTVARREDDRGELGQGWDTTDPNDADRYEDPALAAAAEPAPQAAADALAEQASAAQTDVQTAEAAAATSEVAAEQVAQNVALLEQLQTTAATTAATDTATQLATETIADVVANAAQASPVEAGSQAAQPAAGAAEPQQQAESQIDPELMDALTSNQDADPIKPVGDAQVDPKATEQVREATDVSGPSDLATQMVEALADSQRRSAGAERAEPTDAPQEATTTVAPVAAVDLTAAGLADGQASGPQSMTGGGVDARVTMDPVAAGASDSATAAQAEEMPEPNVDQLAARTVRWRHLGVLGNGGSARIRLDPPSLGSVEVVLRTDGNSVRVELTVESESVRQLLSSNSDRLTQSLQSHGLQTGRIEVTVSTPGDPATDSQGDGQANSGQGQRGQDDGQGRDDDGAFQEEMNDQLNLMV